MGFAPGQVWSVGVEMRNPVHTPLSKWGEGHHFLIHTRGFPGATDCHVYLSSKAIFFLTNSNDRVLNLYCAPHSKQDYGFPHSRYIRKAYFRTTRFCRCEVQHRHLSYSFFLKVFHFIFPFTCLPPPCFAYKSLLCSVNELSYNLQLYVQYAS